MQRSIGVTLSAVVVFIGCAAALLGGVLMVFGIEFAQDQALANPLMRGVLIVEILLDLGFVSWGVASGIGLLKLRGWGRMSMLVFSSIMIFFSVIPMLIFPFVPIPQPADTTANLGLFVRGGLEVFYGFFVALGIFWIYFFNKRSVKEQFSPATESAAVITTPQMQAVTMSSSAPVGAVPGQKRPVLIMVIGVFNIVSCASMALVLLLHTPAVFFGFELHGIEAIIAFATFGAVGLAAGVGLLRFRLWGWLTAVFFQAVGIANIASFLFIPGAMDRFNSVMQRQYAVWGISQSAMPASFATTTTAMLRVSLVFGLVFGVAILCTLIAYRRAFQGAASGAAI